MSQSEKTNPGHSVFQRLLNHAKARSEDFNLLLLRYGVERLLYRLSISTYADNFILKGASLFLVWKGQNYRVTRDADLLGFGPADTKHITAIFKELCQTSYDNVDGIVFMPDTVRAVPIREEQEYDGIRVTLLGMLHSPYLLPFWSKNKKNAKENSPCGSVFVCLLKKRLCLYITPGKILPSDT